MENIKQYIIDFQARKFNVFGREIEGKIKFTKEFITSIIGARRTGKTYLLFGLINKIKERKDVLYVDFDSSAFFDFDGRKLKELVNLHLQLYGRLKYIFFDEIQNLSDWQAGVKELYELKKYFIFMTGSSSKMLSSELATALRGRTITYPLYPLSFREILKMEKIEAAPENLSTEKKNKIIFYFNQYLRYGGHPQIIMEKKLKDTIVKDYKDLVLFRDVVERHNLKNIYIAKRFYEYLISSFGKEISVDKFYNFLKSQNAAVSKKTLYNYLEYFSDSFFFHFLPSQKSRERSRKVYLNDAAFGEDEKGRKLENMVYLELLRRGEKAYFFKEKQECDFAVPKKILIQTAWELNAGNKEREILGLLKAAKYFKIKKTIIITYNEEDKISRDGIEIKIIPFWKWAMAGVDKN